MFNYQPNKLIKSVVVFGVGGTGGRLVPLVTQLLMTTPLTSKARVILMDGDEVEEKNTKRQLFIQSEVGKNKAEVMATRYNRAFGANTFAIPYFFPTDATALTFSTILNPTSPEHKGLRELVLALSCSDNAEFQEKKTILDNNPDNKSVVLGTFHDAVQSLCRIIKAGLTVFVLAVDSVEARQSILTFIQSLAAFTFFDGHAQIADSLAQNIVVIDGGNEDVFGQVNFFNPVTFDLCPFDDVKTVPDKGYFNMPLAVVPFPSGRYLNMVEGVSERRCGDVDQTMSVNNMVATMMHLVFHNLFYNHPMNFHKICFNLNGSMYTEFMTWKWMRGVLSNDTQYQCGLLSVPWSEDFYLGTKRFQDLSDADKALFGVYSKSFMGESAVQPGTYFLSHLYSGSNWAFSKASILDDRVKQSSDKDWLFLSKRSNYLSCSWSEILVPLFHEAYRRNQMELPKYLRLATKLLLIDSSVNFMGAKLSTREGIFAERYVNQRKTLSAVRSGHDKPSGGLAIPDYSHRLVAGHSCVTISKYLRPTFSRHDPESWAVSDSDMLAVEFPDSREGWKNNLVLAQRDGTTVAGAVTVAYTGANEYSSFSPSYTLIAALIRNYLGYSTASAKEVITNALKEAVSLSWAIRSNLKLPVRNKTALSMFISGLPPVQVGMNETDLDTFAFLDTQRSTGEEVGSYIRDRHTSLCIRGEYLDGNQSLNLTVEGEYSSVFCTDKERAAKQLGVLIHTIRAVKLPALVEVGNPLLETNIEVTEEVAVQESPEVAGPVF